MALKRGKGLQRKSPLKSRGTLKSGKKLARRSKTPNAKAKQRAWAAFSLYIRTRDPKCVTCGADSKQAGHFIDGRNNAVLFSEEGVHGQCAMCNVYLHGNKLKYWVFMEKTYGRETIDRLMVESKMTVKYKQHDYERIEQEYKEKYENYNLD